jgi:hypothetical protein
MNRTKFITASIAASVMGLAPIKLSAAQKMCLGQNIPSHLSGPAICNNTEDHICINSLYELGNFIKGTPPELLHSIKILAPGKYPWILHDPSWTWAWRVETVPGRQWYSITRDA